MVWVICTNVWREFIFFIEIGFLFLDTCWTSFLFSHFHSYMRILVFPPFFLSTLFTNDSLETSLSANFRLRVLYRAKGKRWKWQTDVIVIVFLSLDKGLGPKICRKSVCYCYIVSICVTRISCTNIKKKKECVLKSRKYDFRIGNLHSPRYL